MADQPTSLDLHVSDPLKMLDVFVATVWTTASFAPEWFEDALREARAGAGHSQRRREILFSVCCAESYLLEWIRDEALHHDFQRVKNYFPLGDRRGVVQKWKDIPKKLHADGLIANLPDFGGPHGDQWLTLIDYRDGLVHASSSRPETDSIPGEPKPVPSKDLLSQVPPGWAVCTVIDRITRLHAAAVTSAPSWLVKP